jgi:hypothetical protein
VTNEVTQIITRWYGHTEHGVNVMVPTIPRQKIDGSGSWPAPPVVALFDDTMGSVINDSLELEPPSHPSILSFCYNEVRTQVKEHRGIAKNVVIASAYCTQDEQPEIAIRNGGITLRAMEKCLERMNHQAFSEGYKELNDVRVMKIDDISILRMAGAVGRTKMWGIALVTLTAIDRQT